jgi:hypothetical protein
VSEADPVTTPAEVLGFQRLVRMVPIAARVAAPRSTWCSDAQPG